MATKKKADGKTTAKESPVNQDDHRPKSPGKSEKPGQSKKGS
jgi:hypothetical protein